MTLTHKIPDSLLAFVRRFCPLMPNHQLVSTLGILGRGLHLAGVSRLAATARARPARQL